MWVEADRFVSIETADSTRDRERTRQPEVAESELSIDIGARVPDTCCVSVTPSANRPTMTDTSRSCDHRASMWLQHGHASAKHRARGPTPTGNAPFTPEECRVYLEIPSFAGSPSTTGPGQRSSSASAAMRSSADAPTRASACSAVTSASSLPARPVRDEHPARFTGAGSVAGFGVGGQLDTCVPRSARAENPSNRAHSPCLRFQRVPPRGRNRRRTRGARNSSLTVTPAGLHT